jgi:hypothetical protein
MPGSIERLHVQTGATRFITIARQVGAGGWSLPRRLMEALNAQALPGRTGWTAWERELIEKVADDYHLPVQAVEKLEQSGYSWVDTFISGLGGMPEEFAILHRVEESVRALAASGRAILVGHGSMFMSRDLPGGVHIRLVAPLPQRIENMAHRMHLSMQEAATQLKQSQHHWTAFLRRYWPAQSLAPETFAATLNTALMDEDHLVRCIVTLTT